MKKDIIKILENIKIGIITLPLILISGCDYEYFDKGEIYGKVHQPEQYVDDSYIIEGITIPYKEYYNEKYIINLRKWDDENKIYHTLNLEISKEQYDTLNVKDTFHLSIPIKYPSSLFNIPFY
jgi:hypothetical protein